MTNLSYNNITMKKNMNRNRSNIYINIKHTYGIINQMDIYTYIHADTIKHNNKHIVKLSQNLRACMLMLQSGQATP